MAETGEGNLTEPEKFYQEYKPSPKKEAMRILQSVGLVPQDLNDKTVLDAGAGNRYLERIAKTWSFNTNIVSLDKNIAVLRKRETEKAVNAVQGNTLEALPFKDNSFDIIINSGGPISGSPWNENAFALYMEAIRVLKQNGELRINNPFLGGKHSIPDYLHFLATAIIEEGGDMEIDSQEVNQYLLNEVEEYKEYAGQVDDEVLKAYSKSLLDDNGLPHGSYYWKNYFYTRMTIDEQKELYKFFAGELSQILNEHGEKVDIEIGEKDKKIVHFDFNGKEYSIYHPYLIIRKLSN